MASGDHETFISDFCKPLGQCRCSRRGVKSTMSEDNTTYKLERFEVFLISVPPVRRTVTYAILVLAGLAAVPLADTIGFGYDPEPHAGVLMAGMALALVVGGESIHWIVAAYPRSWGYFLALINQALATVALVVGAFIPQFDLSMAVLLALGVMALNAAQVLIITTSFRNWPIAVFASVIQPAVFFAAIDLGGIPTDLGPLAGLVLASALGLVVLAMWLAERMVAINVDVRGLDFSAALTLDRDFDMGIGESTRRWVQTLHIVGESRGTSFVVPWFHPGLMSRIGGGRMSREITGALAEQGGGSYLKPPASHKSDPADPADISTIHETAPTAPEAVAETATRLIELDRDGMTFRGRQYGEVQVIWFDSTAYDDVELPVYDDEIDPATTVVIDCHATEPDVPRNLKAGTIDAEWFREGLAEIREEIAAAPQHQYTAGFAEFSGEIPGFAFVEVVDKERSVVVGLDGNNVTQAYETLREELTERFDHVLLLTTDTHASPFEIDALPPVSAARRAIDSATDAVEPARVGLDRAKTPEIPVLNDDYTKLIDSFNIGARFLIVALGLSYVYLVGAILLVWP